MDPGVGVGEPAGGLGDGHAGEQAVAHGVGGGGGAGVEPGERVGGVAQRDEQAGQLGAGQPGVRAAGGWSLAERRPGRDAAAGRRRFRPGCPARRAEQAVIVVGVGEPAVPSHRWRFPKLIGIAWRSMTDPRRFGRDRFVTSGVFARRRGRAHGRVRPGESSSVR